jgi:hypothetical protein
VLTLATAERRTIIADGFDAQYSPTGHIVYGSGADLFGRPIRSRSLTVAGAPVKLLDRVETEPPNGVGNFVLSTAGTLVFLPQPAVRPPNAGVGRSFRHHHANPDRAASVLDTALVAGRPAVCCCRR